MISYPGCNIKKKWILKKKTRRKKATRVKQSFNCGDLLDSNLLFFFVGYLLRNTKEKCDSGYVCYQSDRKRKKKGGRLFLTINKINWLQFTDFVRG